jgi:UDP-N-acetylglucosamine transferase subunit ALG13
MIFVTVGNATQNSDRLLGAIDCLAREGTFGTEEILVQYGNNPKFASSGCICKAFLTVDEFRAAIAEAHAIVCHAGAGTILHVLGAGKIPVVVPRRLKYGEVIDDHQVQLTEALAASRRVVAVMDIANLESAIGQVRGIRTDPHHADKTPLAALVVGAIEDLVSRTSKHLLAHR